MPCTKPVKIDRLPYLRHQLVPGRARSFEAIGYATALSKVSRFLLIRSSREVRLTVRPLSSVQVDPSLSKLLNDSHEHLQQRLGAYLPLKDLRIFGDASHRDRTVSPAQAQSSSSNSTESLHVSLTRPFTVRSHERDEYIKVATAEVQRLKETVGR